MLGRLLCLMLICLVGACVSTSRGPSYEASEVIERIGEKDETPSWASGAKIFYDEGRNVAYVNTVRMRGDSRPGACMKAASLNAKAEMLKYVEEKITSSGQLNELDAASDPAFESLTAFLSQGTLNGAQISERYWEKIVESDVDGNRTLRLRCAAKVKIKKRRLAKLLREASTPEKQGNPEIREKLLDAQKDFIEGAGEKEVAH